jgi:predicted DNA-binding mobile mystery protein A
MRSCFIYRPGGTGNFKAIALIFYSIFKLIPLKKIYKIKVITLILWVIKKGCDMKLEDKILIIRQLDKKMKAWHPLLQMQVPLKGWIHLIRTTLRMSLQQLGDRLQITPQGMKDIESREVEGTITLKSLREVGDALGMQLVYGFIPKKDNLENMIGQKAYERAQKIVQRTSTSMKLEDQENSEERIKQAITELTEQIKRELPKSLWD